MTRAKHRSRRREAFPVRALEYELFVLIAEFSDMFLLFYGRHMKRGRDNLVSWAFSQIRQKICLFLRHLPTLLNVDVLQTFSLAWGPLERGWFGLMVSLVEHCQALVLQRSWRTNLVQAWNCFRPGCLPLCLFQPFLKCHSCFSYDHSCLDIFLLISNIWSILLIFTWTRPQSPARK